MGDHKPDGHNAVSVYLVSPNASAVMDFVEAVFEARRGRIIRHDNGAIRHCEMHIDDSVVMIGQMETASQLTAMVHVYTADPGACFDRALENGASVIHPVEQNAGDTDKRGGFTDPWGNSWFVACQVVKAGC